MSATCPRCGAAAAPALRAGDHNRAVTAELFEYWRCGRCGVLWLPAVPDDLPAYYPDDYHPSIADGRLEPAADAEQERVALVREHVEPGPLVEIGPSRGAFAVAAMRAGFDVTALEMDAACCRDLERRGVRAINTAAPQDALPALAPSVAAVMWHVIEHLPDPWAVLRAVAANLRPGGVLALATPNPQSLQFRLFGARWVHLDAPRHLTLIPLRALCEEAAALGLRLARATCADGFGRALNRLGWERSGLRAPALRPNPPLAFTRGAALAWLLGSWEARGLRGSAYTAVFVKDGGGALAGGGG